MRVIIDTRWIRSLKIDGVANFTVNVTKQLLDNDNNQYILLSNSSEVEDFICQYTGKDLNNSFYRIDASVTSPKSIFQLRKAIGEINPDLFFSPCFTIYSPFIKVKQVGVVHDLIPLIFPEMFKGASLKFKIAYSNKRILKNSLKHLNSIISVSNSTKNDLISYLKIKDKKINVIVEGVNVKDTDKKKYNSIKEQYNLPDKYFLFVGRHELYKNIGSVIKVYSKLDEAIRKEYKLVIIGKFNEDLTPTLFKTAERLKLLEDIFFIENIMPDNLPYFYKNAKLLIHLSLYEGFGLTVLEAMKYGLPVIVSNRASMPEVAGNSAILVNPENTKEIVEKITNILNNELLYKSFVEKGLKRSENFSWEKSAQQLEDIFKSIL